ncbi:MAG TPA: cytochrome c oxidase subunit 3 family protein [Opitutaceae bacterium]|jgi:cytochrome c oxidase subunit 3
MSKAGALANAPQFGSQEQRIAANQLGMWTLIATEILFFGGLFLSYVTYRVAYPSAFAVGSRHLDYLCGTINTGVLLTSSLCMALGDLSIRKGRTRALAGWISATAALGAAFVCIKGFEYHEMWRDHLVPGFRFDPSVSPQVELFVCLYFIMTGLHAIHMLVGIGLMAWLLKLNAASRFSERAHEPVKMVGLYWHFVDCVWIFLYPLLYLVPKL